MLVFSIWDVVAGALVFIAIAALLLVAAIATISDWFRRRK